MIKHEHYIQNVHFRDDNGDSRRRVGMPLIGLDGQQYFTIEELREANRTWCNLHHVGMPIRGNELSYLEDKPEIGVYRKGDKLNSEKK